jgi:hypothetical protein
VELTSDPLSAESGSLAGDETPSDSEGWDEDLEDLELKRGVKFRRCSASQRAGIEAATVVANRYTNGAYLYVFRPFLAIV